MKSLSFDERAFSSIRDLNAARRLWYILSCGEMTQTLPYSSLCELIFQPLGTDLSPSTKCCLVCCCRALLDLVVLSQWLHGMVKPSRWFASMWSFIFPCLASFPHTLQMKAGCCPMWCWLFLHHRRQMTRIVPIFFATLPYLCQFNFMVLLNTGLIWFQNNLSIKQIIVLCRNILLL